MNYFISWICDIAYIMSGLEFYILESYNFISRYLGLLYGEIDWLKSSPFLFAGFMYLQATLFLVSKVKIQLTQLNISLSLFIKSSKWLKTVYLKTGKEILFKSSILYIIFALKHQVFWSNHKSAFKTAWWKYPSVSVGEDAILSPMTYIITLQYLIYRWALQFVSAENGL